MRKILILALGAALAGCSQTTTDPVAEAPAARTVEKTAAAKRRAPNEAEAAALADRGAEAANEMAQSQTQAAMMGGALSMVGGLGGFAGRGGMIASPAASVGGSVIQSQAQAKARAALARDCGWRSPASPPASSCFSFRSPPPWR